MPIVVGITGHVHLPAGSSERILNALIEELRPLPTGEWRGITCLAHGSDQLFARAALHLNAPYEVVLPAWDYRRKMKRSGYTDPFLGLLSQASSVTTKNYWWSGRQAYLAASETMLAACDLLLAVWDGRPSRQVGDTAHVVATAKDLNIPVTVIWPPRSTGEPEPYLNNHPTSSGHRHDD
jgi:hypothetical protein